MISRYFLAGLSLLAASSLWAAPLSPSQALMRLSDDSASPAGLRRVAPSAKLVKTFDTQGRPGCYVFRSGSSLFVTSADDIAKPLLGYFDADNQEIAPALEYWLQTLSDEVNHYADIAPVYSPLKTAPAQKKAAVTPWLKTFWNQDEPYNDLCPELTDERTVTGCAATSMAQVMKHYNYPTTGTGTKSYRWLTLGKTLTFNYGATTFDWDNMLDYYDIYEENYNAEQASAVATLMYAAGVSIDMDYNLANLGGSSSKTVTIPKALTKYFCYDKSTHMEFRQYYTSDQWEELVYSNIARGPVIYDGQAIVGGHSFVCDGYDGDGFFHFNWGWGGMSDGYFVLSALDPMEQGIGGATSGFDYAQDIVADMKPDAGGDYYSMMAMPDGFSINTNDVNLGETLSVTSMTYNLSLASMSGELNLKAVKSDGTVYYLGSNAFASLGSNRGRQFYVTIPEDLPEGDYVLTPVFRVSGETDYQPVLVTQNLVTKAFMTVKGGVCSFSKGETALFDVSNFAVTTPVYGSDYFNVKAKFVNHSDHEFYGAVYFALTTNVGGTEYMVATTPYETLQLNAGQTFEYDAPVQFTRYSTEFVKDLDDLEGEYDLCVIADLVFNELSVKVGEPLKVNVLKAPEITKLTANLQAVGNPESMNPEDMRFTADISVIDGYFSGYLYLTLTDSKTGYEVYDIASDLLMMGMGQSKTITFAGSYPEIDCDRPYYATVTDELDNISEPVLIIFKDPASVDGIMAEDGMTYTFYTLTGLRVNPKDLLPGTVYVRQTRAADGSLRSTQKVVK